MAKDRTPKDNVIRFPVEGLRKFGFKKARTRGRSAAERQGQLSLFGSPSPEGAVVALPTGIGAFDEALLLDERGESRAEAAYRRAIKEEDHVADAYCNLGIMECRNDNTTAAIECFAQSLAAEPRHFESHYNRANLYFDMGDHVLARTHYQIAASIDPEFPHVYFNLGLVHAMQGDYEAAVEALTKYKELVPPAECRLANELLLMLRQSLTPKPSNH
jgi:tetratricopeptide (TPR) repeat protein